MKRNILMVESIDSQFPDLIKIAIHLKNNTNYNPIFYFHREVYQVKDNLRTLEELKIDAYDCRGQLIKDNANFIDNLHILERKNIAVPVLQRLKNRLRNLLKKHMTLLLIWDIAMTPLWLIISFLLETTSKILALKFVTSLTRGKNLTMPLVRNRLKTRNEKKRLLQAKIPEPPIQSEIRNALAKLAYRLTRYIYAERLAFQAVRHSDRKQIHQKVFEQTNPVLLIFGEDTPDYHTPEIIQMAKIQFHIKSVVFPYSLVDFREYAESLISSRFNRLSNLLNLVFVTFYPKWIITYQQKTILRMRAENIWFYEFYALAPSKPWVMNSGYSDLIAVDSKMMFDYYHHDGIPKEQLINTGFFAQDILAKTEKNKHALRHKLCAELALDPDLKIALFSCPPSQHPRKLIDFEQYEDILFRVSALFDTIPNTQLIIKMHPRYGEEVLTHYENKGLRFCRWDTSELIPLADIYIASISATIRWAIACGIPTINYDLYRYHFTDYKDVPSVITLESYDDFENSIYKHCQDETYFKEQVMAAQQIKGYWGELDGLAANRIEQMLDMLTSQHLNVTQPTLETVL